MAGMAIELTPSQNFALCHQGDELAALHSITSSARASNLGLCLKLCKLA